ncbi:MAG: SDR family NAD(P)-dependent oxidoreductase [Clostridia bacterium]|nr:SDR family NAD(P)-dependent oxidoreductase [Clostridia bacterium]
MSELTQLIIQKAVTGKIDKKAAAEILKTVLESEGKTQHGDIAIVGINVKMPMADNLDKFWSNIRNGVDCISDFPDERKEDSEEIVLLNTTLERDDIKFFKGGYLPDIDKFDYKFFRLSPKEASLMDPNQRLFLETAWGAIEDAGYGGNRLVGSNTGVYVGYSSWPTYESYIMKTEPSLVSMSIPGNMSSIIAGRLSYILDFKGPSMLVDTACSSSLVAVHLACESIRKGECDQAIAAGLKINFLPVEGVYEVGIESKSNETRAFDDNSDGTIWGEGSAAVLLKPLSKALEDRDNIYAVIKGTAINQDGASIGVTAPNALAQEEVIVKAWEDAKIDPETITYIEAHGTGTKLGDPVEITGIQNAFRRYTNKRQFCAIGSVKTNIGHLDNAAGLAGLIKAAMALKNGEIPPSLHFNTPNRGINFEHSPVFVADKLTNWEPDGIGRRCGVSSFGFSGTNCHVVLEEAPKADKVVEIKDDGLDILTISAKSPEVLKELLSNYREFLNRNQVHNMKDVYYTANTGRGHYECRMAVVVNNGECLIQKLGRLEGVNFEEVNAEDTFFGQFKVLAGNKERKSNQEITENEIRKLSEEVSQLINEFKLSGKNNVSLLNKICQLYVKGADVDWDEFYADENRRRVPIPTYPFERNRCWLEVPKERKASTKANKNNLFYYTGWVEEELKQNSHDPLKGTALIFKDKTGISEMLSKRLKEQGCEVIEVVIGKSDTGSFASHFTISGCQQDYTRLFEEIKDKSLSYIFHLSSITDNIEVGNAEQLQNSQTYGVNSLFYIVKAMLQSNIKNAVKINVISRFVNKVTGTEKNIIPENATLFGLGKVVGQEYSNLKCRLIDIDDVFDIDYLISEAKSEEQAPMVCYRNGKRYVEEFRKANIQTLSDRQVSIKDNGVYIITGGAGGIGIEIGKYLARKNKANIVLVSRSKMPDKAEWDGIIQSNEDEKLCSKLKQLKEIEKLGANIEVCTADVADEEGMEKVICNLRNAYGRINGVVHCAGVAGSGFIIKKDEDTFNKVLSPKVKGTWLLDKLTNTDNMDFFVLFSSINSLTGIQGQGDYTAANSYLDSFASYRNAKGKRTLTMNWTGWKETGIAVAHGVNKDSIFKAISNDEAISAFEKVINKDVERVIIAEPNIDGSVYGSDILSLGIRIEDDLRSELEKAKDTSRRSSKSKGGNLSTEVKLIGKENQSFSDYEKNIAAIWKEVLGFEELDVNDNFFDIGGDSILIMKAHALLEECYPGKTVVADLFAYPTIAGLSEYMKKLETENYDLEPEKNSENKKDEIIKEDIFDLFSELESGNLSFDKASKMLVDWGDKK